jgi:predicted nucleic acid-binding protein
VILVDTSVWIEHLRVGEPSLATLLQDGHVLGHPWVVGELALGQLSRRRELLALLNNLPRAQTATESEVLDLVENRHLFGLGIGYVDAHLLAATLLTSGAGLWTRDKRLGSAATQLGLAYQGDKS